MMAVDEILATRRTKPITRVDSTRFTNDLNREQSKETDRGSLSIEGELLAKL